MNNTSEMNNESLDPKVMVDVANDYSSYLKVDFSKDVAMVRQIVDDTLTRLEEFQSVLEMVQNEVGIERLKESILSKNKELDVICDKVDRLEEFVNRVEQDVNAVDALVVKAEADLMKEKGPLEKFLKPLFFKKKETATGSGSQIAPFQPPEIFKTTDFFPPRNEGSL